MQYVWKLQVVKIINKNNHQYTLNEHFIRYLLDLFLDVFVRGNGGGVGPDTTVKGDL